MSGRRPFGSVRQLPSGRWQARYRDAHGLRRAAPETFVSAEAARAWLVGTHADLLRGEWADPDVGLITFSGWADEYLENAIHLRPRTRYKYERIIEARLKPVFGHMSLSMIEQPDVQAFVTEMAKGYAASTVETAYSVLHVILAAAVPRHLLSSPCQSINLPAARGVDDRRRITLAELRTLAAKVPARYRAMVWVTGVLGLRWSEVAGLRVRRVSFLGTPSIRIVETLGDVGGRKSFEPTKTASSDRYVPLVPILRDMLAAHLAAEGKAGDLDALVFSAPRGGPLDYSDFHETVWAPAVAAAGLEGLTFHGLRHSAAGLLRELGVHTQIIARWLGHRDDSRITSGTYGWVPDAADQAAAEAVERALEEASGHDPGHEVAAGEGA